MSDQHFLEEVPAVPDDAPSAPGAGRRPACSCPCSRPASTTTPRGPSTRPRPRSSSSPRAPASCPAARPPTDPMGADFYQTQYELLRGRALLERVIERLGLDRSGELLTGPLRSPWEALRQKLGAARHRGGQNRGPALARGGGLPLAPHHRAPAGEPPRQPPLRRLRPRARGEGRERPGPGLHRAAARVPLHRLRGGRGLAHGAGGGAAEEGRGGGERAPELSARRRASWPSTRTRPCSTRSSRA